MESSIVPSTPQLRHSDWNLLRVSLGWVYREELKLSEQHQEALWQSALYVYKGKLRVTNEKGTVEVGPGNWMFPRAGRRVLHYEPGTECLFLGFWLAWPGEYDFSPWDVALVIPDQEVPELLQQALQMEAVVQKSFGLVMFDLQKVLMDVRTHLRFRRMFYEWLDVYLAALEERGVVPVHIEDKDDQMVPVAGYLDILPWNQNYSVENIALDLGISASQLNRSFRKRYGQTIKQYRESRLEEAARSRLCMSEDSIKSISYDLGFSSPSHFIAWFRKRTGRSPGEVREGSSGGD